MDTIEIISRRKNPIIHSELHGQFIEFLGAAIYDGIWVGEDSSIPNIHGLRKDVVEALQKIHPPVIRWPGGCYADTYHWRNGIGPRKERPITYNENFGTYERDDNSFGTHEFMELCRLVGAKPWFNVNMMTGTPAEMRDWIEYCNRKEDTSLSRERAKNGDKDPFNVEIWGIGNEPWAGGGNMTAEGYADAYRRFSSSIPSFASVQNGGKSELNLKRIACGPDGNKPRERFEWTKRFFKALGQFRCPPIDGYDLHFYNWNIDHPEEKVTEFDEAEWIRVISGCLELEKVIEEQYTLIQEGVSSLPVSEGAFHVDKPVCQLVIGEWGNWHGAAFTGRPALYQQCTMRDAVTTALTLDLLHRNCDKVRMACNAQTVNVLNSLILTDRESCILTPNYYVFDLYQVHREAEYVPLSWNEGMDGVFLTASKKDGILSLDVVNANMSQDKTISFYPGMGARFVEGSILTSSDPHDVNDKNNPYRIVPRKAQEPEEQRGTYTVTLPKASVSVLRFALQ